MMTTVCFSSGSSLFCCYYSSASLQENTKNQLCALKLIEENSECLQGEAVVLQQRNDKARVLLEEQNLRLQKVHVSITAACKVYPAVWVNTVNSM